LFNIKKKKNDFEFEIIGNKKCDFWVEKNKIYVIIFPNLFNNKTKNIKK
jgi:hypothetical protein